MKKFLSFSMLLTACLALGSAHAQQAKVHRPMQAIKQLDLGAVHDANALNNAGSPSLNGVNPSFQTEAVNIWSENFGSNPNTNGWTNYGFRQSNTGSTPDTMGIWEYRGDSTLPASDTGSRGGYAAGTQAIQSPTRTNGFMIFDSDWLDNNGTQGAFGTGIFPCDTSSHRGMLITPAIDLSAYDFVNLSFYQYYRRFGGPGGLRNSTGTYLLFSRNNGLTWSDTLALNNNIAVGNSTPNNNFQRVNISSYVGGEDSVKIAFLFNGDYYFWMIDDIAVEQAPRVDMSITDTKFLPDTARNRVVEYGIIPDSNKTFLRFQARVRNIGTTTRNNVQLQVSVIDTTAPNTPVFTGTSLVLPALDPFTDTLLTISTAYTPTVRKFSRVNYSLNFDSVSLDSTANNTASRQFELTDSLMSVSVSKPTTTGVLGTRNFTGGNDLRVANICELVNTDTVTSATALLVGGTTGTQAGGLIFFTLEPADTTTGFPGGLAAAVLETDLYILTAQDVSRGRVTIPFPATLGGSPQERIVPPGDYWLVANLSSNNGLNHIQLSDDQTVTMPWFASVIYINQWYGNGNAIRMSLNFGRVPRVPGASVADLNEFAAIAYPNPTADLLNIKLSAVRDLGKVQTSLFDMTGRLVRSDVTEANGQSARFTLDLASIPNGTYYLDVLSDAGSKRQRVIVRH
jgi:hypothetical protein